MRALLPTFVFVGFGLLLSGQSMDAQITPRNLLSAELAGADLQKVIVPQAQWQPFPQSSAGWRKILPDSIIETLIKNGEACLKAGFPNVPATVTLDFFRNGNRTRYENIAFGKRNRLWALVLAESVEGKGRFLDAILDGIWSISEESFWGASAHLFLQKGGKGLPDVENPVVDLFAAETAATLAWTDYFIGPELDSISPLIRRRVYYEVNRRVFVPMQTRSADYDWTGAGNKTAKLNNWAPWIMSNFLTATLVLEKDAARRAENVSQVIELTDQYLNGLGDDGACEEGPTYWAFGPGSVLDILDLLQSASHGRINIYHEGLVRNMAAYLYKVHIAGNYFVNISDAHPEMVPEPVMIRRFGRETGDTIMRGFGAWFFGRENFGNSLSQQQFHRTRELFDLSDLREIGSAGSGERGDGDRGDVERGDVEGERGSGERGSGERGFGDIGDAWLPDVQLMISRLAHGLFVAAHAGNNGKSHNHNDVGDFIVYAGGEPVIVDVGSGTYTARTFSKDRYTLWFNTSAYHNLPTINGQEQREGAAYTASRVSYRRDRDKSVLGMDLEKAYPADAGLHRWRRTIEAEKSGRILITDSCRANGSFTALTQSFMTVDSVDISAPGLIAFTTGEGKKVELRYDAKWWRVGKEEMTLSTPEEEGLTMSWHHRPITRVLLSLSQPVRDAIFRYTIVAK